VLGDSFAWGYGVEESERFSQLLEGALGAEVINAGVSGYSTDQELLWYGNEGIKYETDLVILVIAGNDVGDNDRQLVNTIYYKPKFVWRGPSVPKGIRFLRPVHGEDLYIPYHSALPSAIFSFKDILIYLPYTGR
jgi:lysophospholipase L1-like esterase